MNIKDLLKEYKYSIIMDFMEVKYKEKHSCKFALYRNKKSHKEVVEFLKLLLKESVEYNNERWFYFNFEIQSYPYDKKSNQIGLITIQPYRRLIRIKLDYSILPDIKNIFKD